MNIENIKNNKKIGAVMVVGGGIGGMQAALDLAETGIKVYLVDNKPSIGGVMSQLDKTFPTNDCAMCTMAPRLVEIGRHKDIEIITLSDIDKIEGDPGNFTVRLKKRPRFVDDGKCTGCGSCVTNCPVHNEIYILPEEKVEVKLESEDKKKIGKILEKYREKKGALIPILHDINLTYNYLPKHILEHISVRLEMNFSLIYRIATFYNAFKLTPKAKYTVHVCTGTACYIKGAPKILEAFERELGIKQGAVTKDLKFGIGTISCFGCCGQAPVVVVNDDIYGHFNLTKVSKILKSYDENI